MKIILGHSSIDENGNGRGGKAGDQNGKEVCTKEYYNNDWEFVLRAKRQEIADGLVKACKAGCRNEHIGYDMGERNTLHREARAVGYDLSKILAFCECDCSSFMTVCAIAAGVKALEYSGNAPTTWTMGEAFTHSGQFEKIPMKSVGALRLGDILVKPGKHTAMVIMINEGSEQAEKVKIEGAQKFNNEVTGEYRVIASGLNLRAGAGTTKKILMTLKKESRVYCYGYYNVVNGTKWLYVVYNGSEGIHAGYCSSRYLMRC